MKIAVCIKHVAALEDEIELSPDGRDLDAEYLEHSLNEWDACAIEQALRVKDAVGDAELVAVTFGDDGSEESLRRCVAMGVDRVVRVDSGETSISVLESVTTARALASVLATESPDLVLTGAQSSDTVQGATGGALGELLGFPVVAVVRELTVTASVARCHRELEGGIVEVIEADLPAVVTIQTGVNEPRYVNLRAIKQADRHEVEVVAAPDVAAPATRVTRMFVPERSGDVEMLSGSPEAVAKRIQELIAEAAA